MAEAIGLAASIAGLAALAGKLTQGCIYLKGVFEDIKNAPKDVQLLITELNILLGVSKSIEARLEAGVLGRVFEEADFRPALEQCVSTVESLRDQVADDLKRIGNGKDGRWWERIKVVSKKKTMADQLSRLERAKSQILMVQGIAQTSYLERAFQQEQTRLDSLGSISANTLFVKDRFDLQRESITALAATTNTALNTMMSTIMSKLDSIQSDITQPRTALEESDISPSTLSHVNAGIPEAQTQQFLDSFREESFVVSNFAQQSGQTTKPNIDATSNPSHSGLSRPEATVKLSKNVQMLRYSTPLFEVHIKTFQQAKVAKSNCQDERETSSNAIICIRSKLPFWRYAAYIQLSRPLYSSNLDLSMQITTYNIVEETSPIIRAVKDLDMEEVKRLFRLGLASHHDAADGGYGKSLSDIALLMLFTSRGKKPQYSEKAHKMLQFLTLEAKIGYRSPYIFGVFYFLDEFQSQQAENLIADRLRHALHNCPEDPFWFVPSHHFRLDDVKLPIYSAMLQQESWAVDMNGFSTSWFPGTFCETEIHFLKDPTGLGMLKALENGLSYLPLPSTTGPYYGSDKGSRQPAVALMFMAFMTDRQDIQKACMARLVNLFQNGHLPQTQATQPENLGIGHSLGRPYSAVEYSIHKGLEDFLREALHLSGWLENDIQDIFDEEILAGFPQLMNGDVTYKTRDECRIEFLNDLFHGELIHLNEDYEQMLIRVSDNIGWWIFDLETVIRSAKEAFKHRDIPGSWPKERTIIVPGIDFQLDEWAESNFREYLPLVPCLAGYF